MEVTLPRFTRASDIRSLDECMARYVLEKLYADELDEAGYFILGTVIHSSIEKVAADDISLETAINLAQAEMDSVLYDASVAGIGVRWTKRRTAETWPEDIERILTKWWERVHPSSNKRMTIYDEYQWPFAAEHVINVSLRPRDSDQWYHSLFKFRLHTTIDAIFEHNSGEAIGIVDWKTGATAKAKDIQLWTYTTGLRLEDEERPIKAWFHHADHNKIQPAGIHPGDDYVIEWIKETQARKERGIFLASPDWWCSYCRVQDKCIVYTPQGIQTSDLLITYEDDPEVYYGIQ